MNSLKGKITKITFNVDSFGITQRSLKILRDTIAKNCQRKMMVVEIPTNGICCGYMIFIQKEDGIEVVWTGDGFRTDGGGEGSAGFYTAETIFWLYRIRVFAWEMIDMTDIYIASEEKIQKKLEQVANSILQELSEDNFVIPIETTTPYIRG